ncbi:MAG: sn-glycerol-3-phosphate ABC transporter ATP-binding protein UgpC [Elusimicrobia bacterium]|nr:sn-glycerol-3-phosphate ABC transporter ATP-binding protein UgpC [Elusimicrobiota bacterium]MBD3411868.1 sn-glycerol-3-phosphate ABC transporter ATP-binding protein UgpC [Elusimicrobiota bacterium]
MANVVLKHVFKRFEENQPVVKDFNLEIPDKEFCVLVGPSGCGKSTTLRMIAGLEEISDGDIFIGDRRVNDIPPKDRDIAMVFQNYALYPHMNVYKNMAFGLKLRRYSRKEIDQRVQEAAEVLNIGHLLERRPKELSGGQRQRVAVGRAIVRKPKVFLFDEPLSNLDAKLRVQMRGELSKLHHRLKTTMIYVTHDQTEAMTMGDRIVVMQGGQILQVDQPLVLYDNPKSRFVGGFIGSPPMNFMEVQVGKKNGHLYLEESSFELKIPSSLSSSLQSYINKTVTMGIRPEHIYDKIYYTGGPATGATLRATIEVVEPMGNEILLYLTTGTNSLTIRVGHENRARVHQDIDLVVDMNKVHIFDKETEQAII